MSTEKLSSTMSEIALKQHLRKMEYPQCAQEALNKIVNLICGRITSLKYMDLALDLMAEFIFCEVDRRGQKRQPLSQLNEMQLLDIFYDYFNGISNESARNTIFLSLFSGTMAGMRLITLTKLVSMAIAVPSRVILMSASAWMQQLGNTSANCCKLAEIIIQDYCGLYQRSDVLRDLPEISPQFTANFMTAIAENYFVVSGKSSPGKKMQYPPKVLLEIIIHWVSNNSSLCIAAQQKKVALPLGAIAMEATTPIAGLMRWCILAPIHKQNDDSYGTLHYALLESVVDIPKEFPAKAIYAQHVAQLVQPLNAYVGTLRGRQEVRYGNMLIDDRLHLSLERFAQSVQVAYAENAMYGQVDDLFRQMKSLPFNKLLNIVIATYNDNKKAFLSRCDPRNSKPKKHSILGNMPKKFHTWGEYYRSEKYSIFGYRAQ